MRQSHDKDEKREILRLGNEKGKKGLGNWMEKQLGHGESWGSTGSGLAGGNQVRSTSPTIATLSGVSSDGKSSELAENASLNRPCHYPHSYSLCGIYRR